MSRPRTKRRAGGARDGSSAPKADPPPSAAPAPEAPGEPEAADVPPESGDASTGEGAAPLDRPTREFLGLAAPEIGPDGKPRRVEPESASSPEALPADAVPVLAPLDVTITDADGIEIGRVEPPNVGIVLAPSAESGNVQAAPDPEPEERADDRRTIAVRYSEIAALPESDRRAARRLEKLRGLRHGARQIPGGFGFVFRDQSAVTLNPDDTRAPLIHHASEAAAIVFLRSKLGA